MKITINLTKAEIDHIKEHSFVDCCETVWNIMLKVQKESQKRFKQGNKKNKVSLYIAHDRKIKRRVPHMLRNGYLVSLVTGSKFKFKQQRRNKE